MHFRIAPTPSGYLHTGNAFNFLLTERLAQEHAASLRLRIDDLDAPRVRQDFITDIFESLRWLGIQWQEGPGDAADHAARFTQSLWLPRFEQVIAALTRTGRVFACTCSRQEVLAQNPGGQYTGTCIAKALPPDTPGAALRIRTDAGDAAIVFEDRIAGPVAIDLAQRNRHFVIRRRDGMPAYQVASLAQDVDYGITHIVRGADLLESTAAQLYLAQLLGYSSFLDTVFYHHPLMPDAAGGKLSKSAGSESLKAMRSSGTTATEIREAFLKWSKHFL